MKQYEISDLLSIMQKLRDPETGCAWDRQQNFSTIAPYTIEEAYEVADAIERGNLDDLRDELGDLLLQVVFHSQMATEQNRFVFQDVVQAICEKMVRRHPHVFSDTQYASLAEQSLAWGDAKEQERIRNGAVSLMDGIPGGMAEIQRSIKLQERAARVGFDWASPAPVLEKLQEETDELLEAMAGGNQDEVEDELGDLMFVMSNLARQLGVNPASALRRANAKFEKRFRAVEHAAGSRQQLDLLDLEQMEALWQKVKAQSKSGEGADE